MEHFVYIIYSIDHEKYYKGYSTDPYRRLVQHNNKESRYTKHFVPWKLLFLEKFSSKTEALRREKSLKKYSKAQIEELVQSPKNILKQG